MKSKTKTIPLQQLHALQSLDERQRVRVEQRCPLRIHARQHGAKKRERGRVVDRGDLHEALEQHAAHQRTQVARRRHDGLADHLLALPRLQQVVVDRHHLLLRHNQPLLQEVRRIVQHLRRHIPGLAQIGGNVNSGRQRVRLGKSLGLVEVERPAEQVGGRRGGGGTTRRRSGVDSTAHVSDEALRQREGLEGEEEGRVVPSVQLDERAASGSVVATQDGALDALPGTFESEGGLDGIAEDAEARAAQHQEPPLPLPRNLDVGEGDAVDGSHGEFPGVGRRLEEDDFGVKERVVGGCVLGEGGCALRELRGVLRELRRVLRGR